MSAFRDVFDDRLQEIEEYLDFLQGIETVAQSGVPRLTSLSTGTPAVSIPVTPNQQKMLCAGAYLLYYNLVESTITGCIDDLTSAIILSGSCQPQHLSEKLQQEWVRYIARTHHTELSSEKRLDAAMKLCKQLISTQPVSEFNLEKGGGGNWDDKSIKSFCERIGVVLKTSLPVYSRISRPFKDDKRPMEYVKTLRNDLAHGTISFADGGSGITVTDLRDLLGHIRDYLNEVIAIFENFIAQSEYLASHATVGAPGGAGVASTV